MYSTAVSTRIYKKNVEINFSKTVFIEKKAPQTVNSTKTLKAITQEILNIIVNSLKLEVPSLIEQEVRLVRISLLYSMLQYEVPIIDIAQKVLYDDSLKWCLLIIVKGSGSILKEWPDSDKVASTAITILNSGRVSFSGMDLSHIRIPNADLSRAICDSTLFQNADLTCIKLQGIYLRNANLIKAQMRWVDFGERPYLQTLSDISACCYSVNGKLLAIAAGSTIFLLNVDDYNTLLYQLDATDIITSMAMSKNQEWIVSANRDGTITIWSVLKGDLIQILQKDENSINCIAISFDDLWIASGGENNLICIWCAKTSTLLKTLEGHTDEIKSIAISHDNKWLASGSEDKTIRIWNIVEGTLIHTLYEHTNWINSVAISYNDRWLASSCLDYTIRIWNTRNGNLLHVLVGHTGSVDSLVISPNDDWLASGSTDKTIRIWDSKNGFLLRTFSGHTGYITSINVSPDGNWLISGSDDKTLRYWKIKDSKILKRLEGHTASIKCLANSLNGNLIVSGGMDHTVRIWDANSGIMVNHMQCSTSSIDIAINKSCSWLVTANTDRTLRFWDIKNGTLLETWFDGQYYFGVFSISISFDDRLIACACSRDMLIILVENKNEREKSKFLFLWSLYIHSIRTVNFNSINFELIVSAGNDIHIYDINTKALLKTFSGHLNEVLSIAISQDNLYFASGGSDNTIRIWDIQRGTLINTLTGHKSCVNSVVISQDKQWLASVSDDKTLRIWNFSGDCLLVLKELFEINSVCLNMRASQSFLVTGSSDGSIHYWLLYQKNAQFQVLLLWGEPQNILYVEGACMDQVDGLSSIDVALLKQRQAKINFSINTETKFLLWNYHNPAPNTSLESDHIPNEHIDPNEMVRPIYKLGF